MYVLWLLQSSPVQPPEVALQKQLATPLLEWFRMLLPVDPARSIALPPLCMHLAARLRSLMPDADLKSRVDRLVGCGELSGDEDAAAAVSSSSAVSSSPLSALSSKHASLSLRFATAAWPAGAPFDAAAGADAFGPVASALLRLRATELEFRERMRMQPHTISAATATTTDAQPAPASAASSSEASALTAVAVLAAAEARICASVSTPGDRLSLDSADCFELIERLLREARELLDYFAITTQKVALPHAHAHWKDRKQRGDFVAVPFPCVPPLSDRERTKQAKHLGPSSQLDESEELRHRLLSFLQHPARFGQRFVPKHPKTRPPGPSSSDSQAPSHVHFFQLLLEAHPLYHPTNRWMAQLFNERNQATHARPMMWGTGTLEETRLLADEVAMKVPAPVRSAHCSSRQRHCEGRHCRASLGRTAMQHNSRVPGPALLATHLAISRTRHLLATQLLELADVKLQSPHQI